MAIGIGVNTATFAVVYFLLLKPLPYPEPQQLVQIWDMQEHETTPMSFPEFSSISTYSNTFQSVAAYFIQNATVIEQQGAENVSVLRASSTLLPLLSVHTLIGPGFSVAADTPGSAREAILSFSFWQKHYARDNRIVGQTMRLGDQLYTIVGVTPSDFAFAKDTEIITPLRLNTTVAPEGLHFLSVVGRMKPHLTPQMAESEYQTASRSKSEGSITQGVHVVGLQEELTSGSRSPILVLFSATSLIVLIALANIAILLLVRSAARQKELGVRLALGASRFQISRQLVLESTILSLAGGTAGVFLAWLFLRWAHTALSSFMSEAEVVKLHSSVILFTIMVTAIAGLLFGLSVVFHGRVKDIQGAIRSARQSGVGLSIRRWQEAFIAAEIALTVILLLGSGLLGRSFVKITQENKGFSSDSLVCLQFKLSQRYSSARGVASFISQVEEKIRTLPWVQSDGMVSSVPLSSGSVDGTVRFSAHGETAASSITANKILTDGDYFSSLRIPLIAGRLFNSHDSKDSAPVALIDQALAQRICKDSDCIGKLIDFGWGREGWLQIVGVVGAVRQDGLDVPQKPTVYVPYVQRPELLGSVGINMVIRTTLRPSSAENTLRVAVAEIDKSEPPPEMTTMQEIIDTSLAKRRILLSLLSLLAAMAILLSVLGIYGVMSYTLTTRTSEFALYLALGAGRRRVFWFVLARSLKLAGIGIAIGVGAAIASNQLLASMLYGIRPLDPLTFVATVLLTITVTFISCWFPAHRAMNVEPAEALKYE